MAAKKEDVHVQPGDARCPGVSWTDLLGEDSRPVPDVLTREVYHYRGSEPIAASRYTDPAFFHAELAKMWPRVWQWAAREEDMPETGDTVVYENAGRSYLVTRQPDGSVCAQVALRMSPRLEGLIIEAQRQARSAEH